MRRARCKVVLNCPPELEIYTEPGSLSQAMTNLMVNATLHAFEGIERREVTITASLIENERIRIDVADNGRGMTEEAAGKAFTPFFTTRHKSGGSGLGLFSSRRSIEQVLGGRISFESRLGQGTIFHIELPLNATQQAKEQREF
jgi:signal transduction histidine kinase